MLKDLITNSLTKDWKSKEEIIESICSIGFGHDRSSIERALRKLSEEGFIEKDTVGGLKYKKRVRQEQLL